jgi:hypothetical protein
MGRYLHCSAGVPLQNPARAQSLSATLVSKIIITMQHLGYRIVDGKQQVPRLRYAEFTLGEAEGPE